MSRPAKLQAPKFSRRVQARTKQLRSRRRNSTTTRLSPFASPSSRHRDGSVSRANPTERCSSPHVPPAWCAREKKEIMFNVPSYKYTMNMPPKPYSKHSGLYTSSISAWVIRKDACIRDLGDVWGAPSGFCFLKGREYPLWSEYDCAIVYHSHPVLIIAIT